MSARRITPTLVPPRAAITDPQHLPTPVDRHLPGRVPGRITFVVTTRNSARTIGRCIASLAAQGQHHEIIVVDHESTDPTRSIIEQAGMTFVAGGPSRAAQRNQGADLATGEFVAFLDGDQLLAPGAAEEIVATFRAFASVAALVIPEYSFGANYISKGRALEKLLYDEDPAAESAQAFRASVFERLGGFDDSLPERFDEFEFTDRLRLNGVVVSRIERSVRRDEGHPSLRTIYRESVRYGAHWRTYRALRPTDRPMVRGSVGDGATLRANVWRIPPLLIVKLVASLGILVGRWLTPRWATALAERSDEPDTAEEISWVRRRTTLIVYTLPIALVSIATFTWFGPGHFIAGGGLGPFYRGYATESATQFWGYTTTGAGGPTADAPRLFEGIVFDMVRLFGGGASTAQHVFYALVLGLAVGGLVFCFRQILPDSVWAPSVAAVLALANPGVAALLPDPLIPATLAAAGFLAGMIIRSARKRTSFRMFAAATLPVAYIAVDPALLGLVGIVAALALGCATALSGWSGSFRAAQTTVRYLPLMIVLHLWWLGPVVVASSDATSARSATAGTAPSLSHIVTMTSHRAWDGLPWTVHFREWPLIAMKWFFPIVALLAPMIAVGGRLRRVAVGSLLAALAATIAIQKGAGADLLLVVCLATNALIAFHGMFIRASLWRSSRHALRIAALYIALGIGVTGFPLFTGAVAPAGDATLPATRVRVPPAWERLGRDLEAARTLGKVLVLPSDESQHETTNWGYRGVANLVQHITSRPTIVGSSGAANGPAAAFGATTRAVEDQLAAGRHGGLNRLLDALGISHIVVRHDLIGVGRGTARHETLTTTLEASGLFRPQVKYGSVATVFKRSRSTSPVQAFSRIHSYDARDPRQGADTVTGLSSETAGIGVGGAPPKWASEEGSAPNPASVSLTSAGPHGYRGRINIGSGRDVVVALTDTADSGWRLSGVPAGAAVTPIIVDGFRQGWWVRSSASFDVAITYRPATFLRWLQLLSLAAALFIGWSVVSRLRARRLAKRPGNYMPALHDHRMNLRFTEQPVGTPRSRSTADAHIEVSDWLERASATAMAQADAGPAGEPIDESPAPIIDGQPPQPAVAQRTAAEWVGDLSELDAILALQDR